MKTSFLFIFLALVSSNLWAKKIQIIHINDLHSYFAEHQDGRGGYSKVKTVIDKLKSDAKENGIESIILDAGDWGEGNSYFLSNEGANSYRALGLLGVDVTIMGNHDHMMGGAILANQINKANVKTKILSANLIQTPQMNLKDIMKPTAVLEVDGLKIHIIGLSTAEPHHQGALFPGLIVPPETVMPLHAKRAKNAGADLIVALTHIGKGYDKRLAKLSKNIDVIVGGHSHDRIEEVIYQKSKSGIQVPIVQTGSFGVAVGSLIIDVKGPGKSSVVSYKLHDVTPTIEKEPIVQNFVQNAFDERNELFDGRWDEIIGTSEITIAGYQNGKSPKKASCWGEHMAEITRVGGKTDIGLYMANFTGTEFPAGNITLGMMVDNFPHFRNYGDMGWEISRFRLKGKKLKLLLRAVIGLEKTMGLNAAGFTYNRLFFPDFIPWIGGKALAFNLKIKGNKIKKKQDYTVAIPAEIEYVLKKMLPNKAGQILAGLENTGAFFWTEMEKYVSANSPIRCMNSKKK